MHARMHAYIQIIFYMHACVLSFVSSYHLMYACTRMLKKKNCMHACMLNFFEKIFSKIIYIAHACNKLSYIARGWEFLPSHPPTPPHTYCHSLAHSHTLIESLSLTGARALSPLLFSHLPPVTLSAMYLPFRSSHLTFNVGMYHVNTCRYVCIMFNTCSCVCIILIQTFMHEVSVLS